MTSPSRKLAVSVAVTVFAVLCLAVAGPAGASAGFSAAVTTSTTAAPAPPGSTDAGAGTATTVSTTAVTTTPTSAVSTTTTSTAPTTTVAPVPDTSGSVTTSIPATTVPPATTSTTLGAAQLAALIQAVGRDVAQAQAVNDYLSARALASSLGAGQTLPAGADPVLVAAAGAQLEALSALTAAQQRYAQARHRIGEVAVALYLGEQVPHAGAAILGSLGDRTAFLAGILDAEQREAKAAKAQLATATAAANQRRQQADGLVQSRTVELQANALQAAAVAQSQATALGGPPTGAAGPAAAATAPGVPTQESPTILGPSTLSADELVGWFTASHRHPNLTVSLPVLAADFESVGAAAGVRADIAFAQSVLETGSFSFPSFGQVAVADNNFAGIGACDSCASGFHFPDARTGVTAQMQLLHAYATTSQPVAGPLPGPFRVAGCCPTWMALTGVWATAPDYGIKIMKLYLSMVQWALARRIAAAQL